MVVTSSSSATVAPATPNVLRCRTSRSLAYAGARLHVDRFDGGWRGVVVLEAPGEDARTVDEWRAACIPLTAATLPIAGAARVLKDGLHGQVVQTQLTLARTALDVVCKSSYPASLTKQLGTAWRGPKEYREFWLGHRLRHVGIRTPVPLACLWRPIRPAGFTARIVTRLLPDACGLDEVAVRLAAPTCSPATRRREVSHLAKELGDALRKLGGSALFHRDLKASNVMIRGAHDQVEAWLIDPDGVASERMPCGPGYRRSVARLASSLLTYPRVGMVDLRRGLGALLDAKQSTDWRSHWREFEGEIKRLQARKSGRKNADKLASYDG